MKGTVNGKSLDQVLSELKGTVSRRGNLRRMKKMKRIFRLKAWRAV